MLDAAQRVAGVGALGLKRYVVLVQGDGGSDGAALIDLKTQNGSSMIPRLKQRQPRFGSEAARVVAIENRMQAVGPAFLTAARIAGSSFTLRELQPSADKLDLSITHPDRAAFESVIESMGELTAWAQLRCAGRDRATDIDGLMAFARNADRCRPLIGLAKDWAGRIFEDWGDFRASKLASWAERRAASRAGFDRVGQFCCHTAAKTAPRCMTFLGKSLTMHRGDRRGLIMGMPETTPWLHLG